jgi:hypothetical protein
MSSRNDSKNKAEESQREERLLAEKEAKERQEEKRECERLCRERQEVEKELLKKSAFKPDLMKF